MKKEFNLQKFKSASSNIDNFLKGKGYTIPRSTMLNALSVFLGSKNWNTLQAELKEPKSRHNPLQNMVNNNYGLFFVCSSDFNKIDEYINKKAIPFLFDNLKQKKIIQYTDIIDKYNIDVKDNLFYQINTEYLKNTSELIRHVMRRDLDYLVINNLSINNYFDDVLKVAMSGHLVICGIVTNEPENLKENLFNQIIEEDKNNFRKAMLLNEHIRDIIILN